MAFLNSTCQYDLSVYFVCYVCYGYYLFQFQVPIYVSIVYRVVLQINICQEWLRKAVSIM